jgi:hypothetical protein
MWLTYDRIALRAHLCYSHVLNDVWVTNVQEPVDLNEPIPRAEDPYWRLSSGLFVFFHPGTCT